MNIFIYISEYDSFFTADCPFLKNNFLCIFIFLCFLKHSFIIDFDGYYIVSTNEDEPRRKIFSVKCGTNICFINSTRFGPPSKPRWHSCMPSPLSSDPIRVQSCVCCLFWTNRHISMAVTSIFLSISLSN